MSDQQRYQQAKRITLWSAGLNAFLGLLKVIFGWLGHSHALLADGIHSFSDLITDVLVIFAARFGAKEADLDHPYGHGRIETLATTLLSVILILAGVGIILDALRHMQSDLADVPRGYVFFIAFASMVFNEVIFFYTNRVAEAINSDLIRANAWHHRVDALTSLIVCVGLIGTYCGYRFFDALAAVIVGGMVIKMGAALAWGSMRELIDTGLDENELQLLRQQIATVSGVKSVHQLRTRSSSGKVFVDVHVIVDSQISVSEGHHIGQAVHENLCRSIVDVSDVVVHVDPEDDEIAQPSLHLPNRQEVVQILQQHWQSFEILSEIRQIQLHYLDGRLQIDLILPIKWHVKLPNLANQLQQAVADIDYIKEVKIFYID